MTPTLDLILSESAACHLDDHLPWTSDETPSPGQMENMRSVCRDCPVRRRCAQHALTAGSGFYAGVWVPNGPVGHTGAIRRLRVIARMG